MHFSCAAIALAALSLHCALAQPAHQRHHHKHKRGRPDAVHARDVDFSNKELYKDVDWVKVFESASAVAASAAATPAASPAASPAETSSGLISASGPTPLAEKPNVPKKDDGPKDEKTNENKPKDETAGKPGQKDVKQEAPKESGAAKGFGGRTVPVDDGVPDHYIGNVGIPYGSNMHFVDESERGSYKYSLTLTNINDVSTTYIVWNKSGKNGQPQSGMGLEPNLKFTIGPQESRVIAFDENSQLGFSRDCERNKLGGNLPDCTWGEADFGNLQNGGWSGYDCSSIANSKGNVDYCRMTCEGGKTSSHEGNMFTDPSQTNAGGSLAPGPVAFYAEL